MLSKKIMGTGVVLALAAGGVFAGVSAANAAPSPSDASGKGATPSTTGSVEVAGDGTVTSSGDVVAFDDGFQISPQLQAELDAAAARFPDGAAIMIDKDGNVTAEPLSPGEHTVTNTAERE